MSAERSLSSEAMAKGTRQYRKPPSTCAAIRPISAELAGNPKELPTATDGNTKTKGKSNELLQQR